MQDLFREEIVEGQKDYEPLPIGECNEEIMSNFVEIIPQLRELPIQDLIETLNAIKRELHKISPFKMEPVDCVEWVRNDTVIANDYNPNSVAPTEMKLLAHSIGEDGYTQPIVSWMNALKREVVDGFHRHLVGKSSKSIRARVHGYLPVTTINDGRLDKGDRMAATIRHNRARGEHRLRRCAVPRSARFPREHRRPRRRAACRCRHECRSTTRSGPG